MLELEHEFRIVDVHARLSVDEDTTRRGRTVSPERLEREYLQAGVVRAVVFPDDRPQGYLRFNNAVARLSVDRPFIAFARIDGPRSVDASPRGRLRNLRAERESWHASPEDVEQYAYDDRFHGFVIDPAADGLPDEETLEMLAAVDLPVIVRAGRTFPPERLAATLLDREITVIAASFAAHPLQRDLMEEAIDMLADHDDLYLDTSHVRYREPLERALLEHPDRVLFGTGAPAVHPNVAVMEILTLDVSADKLRRVFEGNPQRVVPALAPE